MLRRVITSSLVIGLVFLAGTSSAPAQSIAPDYDYEDYDRARIDRYLDAEVSQGHTYYYRVRAVDAAGKVWATNMGSDTAMRIDPGAGPDGLVEGSLVEGGKGLGGDVRDAARGEAGPLVADARDFRGECDEWIDHGGGHPDAAEGAGRRGRRHGRRATADSHGLRPA